jgi:hypothetical protein
MRKQWDAAQQDSWLSDLLFSVIHIQVVLVLHQDYICEKRTNQTKLSFKTVYFLGVGGLTTSSYVAYEYTTSGHTDL